jgi:hypothetical protein
MANRHKIFLSLHAADINYKNMFIEAFGEATHSISSRFDYTRAIGEELNPKKIRDTYLKDTSVTVALIGPQTWESKYVDWELSASLRNTEQNLRSGIIGIVLPGYPLYDTSLYGPETIPARLNSNLRNRYAQIYTWPDNMYDMMEWIHEAYQRRGRIIPDNTYPLFKKNVSNDKWAANNAKAKNKRFFSTPLIMAF